MGPETLKSTYPQTSHSALSLSLGWTGTTTKVELPVPRGHHTLSQCWQELAAVENQGFKSQRFPVLALC